MKKIIIHSNPDYAIPKKNYCVSIVKNILKRHNIKTYNICIIFTSDVYVSDLKKEFFSKNQWTDVIAFPMQRDNNIIEGEIYISMPTAKENADKYNQTYGKEVARLIIHGSLHLLGYVDDTLKQKKEMSNLEEVILNETKWEDFFE